MVIKLWHTHSKNLLIKNDKCEDYTEKWQCTWYDAEFVKEAKSNVWIWLQLCKKHRETESSYKTDEFYVRAIFVVVTIFSLCYWEDEICIDGFC